LRHNFKNFQQGPKMKNLPQRTSTTKITTTLVAFAAFATMMVPIQVYCQINEEDISIHAGVQKLIDTGIKLVEELPIPVKEVVLITGTGGGYLKTVAENFEKNRKLLNSLENEYKNAHEKAKNIEARQKITTENLKRRLSIVESTLGDLEFAQTKFNEFSTKVNNIIGNIDGNKDLADKARQEMAKTKELENEMKNIKREYDSIIHEKPKRGTPEYMERFNKEKDLISRYEIALGEFDNAVYLGYVFENLADQLQISGDQVEGWLIFLANTSTQYAKNIATLNLK